MTNSLALIPVFAGTINSHSVQLCDARTLHTFMVVLRDFSNWIKGRIRKFGFVEGADYLLAKSGEQVPHQGGMRKTVVTEYHLTLDMAKELAMVENNPKGREARRYFIDCETQATRPMLVSLTITTAQAQHLTELVDLVVESGRQKTHAETWARFHRKMGVNKYSLLPAAKFDEAIDYLRGKMDDQSVAALIQKHLPNAVPAITAKNAATDYQYQPALSNRRWLISFDHTGREVVQVVPADAFVCSAAEMPQMILQSGSPFSRSEVLKIAQHANMRMMGEVNRIKASSDIERLSKTVRTLGASDLNEIAQQAWMELAFRTAGPSAAPAMA